MFKLYIYIMFNRIAIIDSKSHTGYDISVFKMIIKLLVYALKNLLVKRKLMKECKTF